MLPAARHPVQETGLPLSRANRVRMWGLRRRNGRRAEPLGKLIASCLAGAWRPAPPRLGISADDLAEVTPLLLGTGAGGLGWWTVRDSDLSTSPSAFELRQAYRLHTLQAATHERKIAQAIKLLRSVGVEPLLAKGWAAARLYPEKGLRPYGDLDLWVRPEQHAAAAAVASSPAGQRCVIDLHQRFRHLERGWDELYGRSRLVPLGDVEVRILGPEDHLRLLCLHMLFHGIYRPLWLCDVGAAVESTPADFDWEYCLEGKPRYSEWVAMAIGLARELLGARLDGAPAKLRTGSLPHWLPASVQRQWASRERFMETPSMAFCLRHPSLLLKAIRLRWPDPIKATVGVRGPFNDLPRLPFQLAECVARTMAFLGR